MCCLLVADVEFCAQALLLSQHLMSETQLNDLLFESEAMAGKQMPHLKPSYDTWEYFVIATSSFVEDTFAEIRGLAALLAEKTFGNAEEKASFLSRRELSRRSIHVRRSANACSRAGPNISFALDRASPSCKAND